MIGTKIYIYAGILAVLTLLGLRIAYLQKSRDIAVLELNMVQYQVDTINKSNTDTLNRLQKALSECARVNKQLQDKALRTVAIYQKDLDIIRKRTSKDAHKAQEALQDEICATITIPSDVERVLRNRAASINGDTGS